MSFMFSEPLIINDDQWLRKHEAHWRFIDEAMPYGIDFIANIGHDVVHFFFMLLFVVSLHTYMYVHLYVRLVIFFHLTVVCTI